MLGKARGGRQGYQKPGPADSAPDTVRKTREKHPREWGTALQGRLPHFCPPSPGWGLQLQWGRPVCKAPPSGHTGAAGTNISFIFVSLILLVLTKGSSRVERVVEGAHAASTGAVCVEEKIKEKSDGWHAGSALSLSPSLSLSIYFPLCC